MKRVISLFLSIVMMFGIISSVDLSAYAADDKKEAFSEVLLKENIQFFKEYFLSDLDPTRQAFYIDHLTEMNHENDDTDMQVLQDTVNRVQKKWSQIFKYMPDSITGSQISTMGNNVFSYLNGTIEVFKNIKYITSEDTRISQQCYHGLHAVNTTFALVGINLGPISVALKVLEKFFVFSDLMYVTFMDQLVQIQVNNYALNLYIDYWSGQELTPPSREDVVALSWSDEWVENYVEGAYEQYLLYSLKRMKDEMENMTVEEPINEKGYYNGHTYQVFSNRFDSFEAANKYCELQGGHLAVIESKEENETVYKFLRNFGAKNAFLGVKKVSEGVWTDIYGNNLEDYSFTNWGSGEPNNEGNNENVLQFWQDYPDGKWNDFYWGKGGNYNFICEWDYYIDPYPTMNDEHHYAQTVVAPTCTTDGYTINRCTDCGLEYYSNNVTKLGHNYNFSGTVAPTCTAQGYDVYTCSRCNATEKRNTVSAKGHDYQYQRTVAPTCTAQGYDLYTCSVCNGTEKRNTVDATGHTYEVISNTATCTEAGIKTSICSKCGDKKEEDVSALGHTYSKVYTAPTCTETGGYTNTCTRCGNITYDVYAAKGHDYGEIVGQDYVNKITGSTISANPNYFNEFYHTSSSIGSTATAANLSTNMAVPNEIRLDINNMGMIKDYQFAIKSGFFGTRDCKCIFAYNESTGRSPEESAIPYTDSDGNLVDMHYIDYKTNNEWVSGQYLIKNNKIVDLSGNIVCDNFTETRPHIVYTKSEALEKGIMNSDGTVNVNTELANQVSFSAGIPGVYFTATNIIASSWFPRREFVDVFGFDETMQDQIKSGKYDVNLCFYEQSKSGFSKTTYKIYDGSLIKKIPATLTEDERTEYTCMDCGETHVETCALNLADFKIAAASISLADNIRMNYKVLKTAVADFENPYIEVTRNGKTVKITEYTEQGDYYVFSYKNIAPQCMGDTLSAVLYGTHNGILYSSNPLDFSVKEYAYRMLQICEPEQYSSLRTLLVDMLDYGSKAQIYMSYNTDKLVNADLTEQQKLWASNDDVSLTNIANPNYKEIENASVVWKGAGLSLYDSISVRYTFTAENINDLSFRVTCNDRVWTYGKEDITDNGDGTYSVMFKNLNADQMSDEIYITAYRSDTEVSNTLCYSVESYAALIHSSMPNTALENLTRAMLKYGISAKNYAK